MKNRLFILLICLLFTLTFTACGKSDQAVEEQSFKMGTTMTLKVYGSKASSAIEAAFKRIDEIEQIASASIETSDVSKINQAAGKDYITVHPEITTMVKTALEYSEISNGAFDITVAPLIKLWGIRTIDQRVPSDAEIKSTLPLVGYKNISIDVANQRIKLMKEGMSIDLGGIAKGFAADEVIKIFQKYGIKRAIINLGGSTVYTLGQKPDGNLWSIGIQHPRKDINQGFTCIVSMPQQALSTSGDYERFFIQDDKRYHHILNPFTGYPADAGIMSDTIILDSSIPNCNMLADILTKVTFVSGVEKGFKIIDSIPGVSCLAQTSDFKIYKSSNWKYQLDDISPDFTLVN